MSSISIFIPSPRLGFVLLLTGLLGSTKAAETHYRVDLSERFAQQANMEVTFRDVLGDTLDFHLPAWRSGLYLLIEPVGSMTGISVTDGDGQPLAYEQTAKSSWRVSRPEADSGDVVVRYRIYADSLSNRTRDVTSDHAFLNPAAVLIYADTHRDAPIEVEIDLPEGWRAASGMEQPTSGRFVAPHYDRLVDSPIEVGVFDLVTFEAGGMTVDFLIDGEWDQDEERLAHDIGAIVDATVAVFEEAERALPAERYLFILHSRPGFGGGTEYYNSTVVHTDPNAFWDDKRWRGFLDLIAHEFFHTWNVKRFRPAGINRYNYLGENYTELLWVAEGLTSYYDQLLPVRAGLVTPAQYRTQLAETIDAVIDRPGYSQDTLAKASFEAWTKGYHRGTDRAADKVNRGVSFYSHGGLLGLILDLEIRRISGGERSLDTVMSALYDLYPLGEGGYTYEDFRALLAEASDADLAARLDGWVYQAAPLPVTEVLETVGWALDRKDISEAPVQVTLGLSTRGEPPVVQVARLDGPGWRAGVNTGDVLLALDHRQIGEDLNSLLRRYQPGDEVELVLFRDGTLKTLSVTVDPLLAKHALVADKEAGEEAVSMRLDWLGGVEDDTEEE